MAVDVLIDAVCNVVGVRQQTVKHLLMFVGCWFKEPTQIELYRLG